MSQNSKLKIIPLVLITMIPSEYALIIDSECYDTTRINVFRPSYFPQILSLLINITSSYFRIMILIPILGKSQ